MVTGNDLNMIAALYNKAGGSGKGASQQPQQKQPPNGVAPSQAELAGAQQGQFANQTSGDLPTEGGGGASDLTTCPGCGMDLGSIA